MPSRTPMNITIIVFIIIFQRFGKSCYIKKHTSCDQNDINDVFQVFEKEVPEPIMEAAGSNTMCCSQTTEALVSFSLVFIYIFFKSY